MFVLIYLLLSCTFIILAVVINFSIDSILIPDPCLYHIEDMPFLMDLFYDLPSANGGHPQQNWFNALLTIGLGLYCGIYLSRRLIRRFVPVQLSES